ncbi:unnamed protein product [Ceratitis capitata]|uniref:(Mediterranean fruit fly) hypothetical protein n=1 Tax=Ceratitis capitata TaxID=7213 RepID=A0A811V8E8_CERCA|nr:unnamed protein product [Ceratitis capitata]
MHSQRVWEFNDDTVMRPYQCFKNRTFTIYYTDFRTCLSILGALKRRPGSLVYVVKAFHLIVLIKSYDYKSSINESMAIEKSNTNSFDRQEELSSRE